MIHSRKVRIGNFNADDVTRSAPDNDKFKAWLKLMDGIPEMKDYDMYLWGSWPDKKDTKDIDILLTKGVGELPTTEEMEMLSLENLEKSLVDNDMLVDMGFTDKKVHSFNTLMNIFDRTGKSTPVDGYTYGAEWFVDDQQVKDRMSWTGPFVEKLDNNIVHLGGAIPYAKQLNDRDNFEQMYSKKPVLIKGRSKIYGQ